MNERPFLTVDCVVFHGNAVVLIRRAHDPFKGWNALPGGFVEAGETVEDACRRETREETMRSGMLVPSYDYQSSTFHIKALAYHFFVNCGALTPLPFPMTLLKV